MPLNSVITNSGALTALQSLNKTNDALAVSQKRVSTGLRVNDAKDDGAAFAVAQKVRGDVSGVTSANEQLGGAKGLLDTTLAGLNKISSTMTDIKNVMLKLADDKVTGTDRTNYESQYDALTKQIGQYVNDSEYNGATLLGKSDLADGETDGGGTAMNVVRNEKGDTYSVAAQATAAFNLNDSSSYADAAAWKAAVDGSSSTAGDFSVVEKAVNTALNDYGNASKAIDSQISFNKDKLDALNSGLGALIDADLAKESATMQSLQIRQQLGTTSLSTANQAPQSLLSLFQ
ncbi:flagellin [Roseicella aquatilis]|uniref:Flagellin n=1 Tax=Roseicella aquatilis TaxID=2527868 RepID=A0A4R4DDP8_9PROT|nr:flagellin [Roseicella aquatilis]TCZ57987.1 flagellin [Roseicella aquatilis]